MYWRLEVHIWELDDRGQKLTVYPTVIHAFNAATAREAEELCDAHKGTDEFLRGALEEGAWDSIGLHVVEHAPRQVR